MKRNNLVQLIRELVEEAIRGLGSRQGGLDSDSIGKEFLGTGGGGGEEVVGAVVEVAKAARAEEVVGAVVEVAKAAGAVVEAAVVKVEEADAKGKQQLMGFPKKMIQASLARFGATTGSRLLSRLTVQSTARGLVRKLVTGSREKPYRTIPSVERATDRIVEILQTKIPSDACLGIDGIAGSGKSTLGRSLALKLGLKWQTLYAREMNSPLNLKSGTIYENIRLLRTQNLDQFDAIFYIDIPVDEARARVLDRDRDGALVDVLDFEKLKRLGDLAFEVAEGKEIKIPQTSVRMKIRPKGGYRARENLISRLEAAGIQAGNLSTEEMLFLLCYGEAQRGIRPYLKLGAYNRELLAGLLAGLLVAFDKLS